MWRGSCSGTGTLRRNPDLKWRTSPEAIARLVEQQRAILAAAARLVKPGGVLVYGTCSLLAEENEAQVQWFEAAHPAFVREPARPVLQAQGAGQRLVPVQRPLGGPGQRQIVVDHQPVEPDRHPGRVLHQPRGVQGRGMEGDLQGLPGLSRRGGVPQR